ncbi:MAG: HAMP domain-containing protein, partial [Burkholderiales bacterium]|nr:HAMP domain-containing protein [Burkholderiales bacterium]
MWQAINRSVRRKLMLVVLATTFTALLVTAIALVVYNLRNYRQSSVEDLVAQADIIARASAPALTFDDPEAARANLALLKVKPKILAGAIYTPAGTLFATYAQNADLNSEFPRRPAADGYRIEGNQLTMFHSMVENKKIVGTVYLRAHYEFAERLVDHLSILSAVMVVSFLIAVLMSLWLQRAVTQPILDVATVARNVMQQRDFSLRVQTRTDDEIGVLVDAFNDMLAEVGRRAEALEASNRTLQHEMHERRGAEQALLLADRRKDEFLATLAHELRNPLAPLRTALHILSIADEDAGMAKSARDMMERQLKQMVRLVDDLLDVSRITTGKLTIRKDRIELGTVIRSAVEPVRSFIEARSHVLSIDLPQEPLYLDADSTRLAQVFSNLL